MSFAFAIPSVVLRSLPVLPPPVLSSSLLSGPRERTSLRQPCRPKPIDVAAKSDGPSSYFRSSSIVVVRSKCSGVPAVEINKSPFADHRRLRAAIRHPIDAARGSIATTDRLRLNQHRLFRGRSSARGRIVLSLYQSFCRLISPMLDQRSD